MVTGKITVNRESDTDVKIKNCASFSTSRTEIDDVFIDEVDHIYLAMPMYNLIENSDNYSDILVSLWRFKRDGVPAINTNFTIDNSQSFKYEAALGGKIANANNKNSFVKNTKLVVPLKY